MQNHNYNHFFLRSTTVKIQKQQKTLKSLKVCFVCNFDVVGTFPQTLLFVSDSGQNSEYLKNVLRERSGGLGVT